MEHNDNFDALFARFKQAIRERREPKTVRTMSHLPFPPHDGRFYSTRPHIEGEQQYCAINMDRPYGMVIMKATRDDLINIAEHCLLRAAQFPHTDE